MTYSKHKKKELIIGTEHNTKYYYRLEGDSLFVSGFENSTTKMKNIHPELLMKFPLQYLAETNTFYQSEGEYCDRLRVRILGYVNTKVDAYGSILLPNDDTLQNVLRVKTQKQLVQRMKPFDCASDTEKEVFPLVISDDSISRRISNDVSVIIVDNYKWYAAGCRYPIFETQCISNSFDKNRFITAFFYSLKKQQSLRNDTANFILSSKLKKQIDFKKKKKKLIGTNHMYTKSMNCSCEFYPNPVNSQLNIKYCIPERTTVDYKIFSINGTKMYRSLPKFREKGIYVEKIELSGFVSGNYLVKMNIGEKSISQIVIKK